MKYFYDKRYNRLVSEEEADLMYLAPECYYEYKCSPDDLVHEKWYCGDDKFIDFTWSEELGSGEREAHFKKHDSKPLYLVRYAVPNEWFNQALKDFGYKED